MFSMDSGELRHPIMVLRPVITKDEDNIPQQTLKELFTTRAKITNVRGSEARMNNGVIYVQEKRVHFRMIPNNPVMQSDIIRFNGQDYNITYVNNIEEMNRFYELKMELVQ